MKMRLASPTKLIYISGIRDLSGIRLDGNRVVIGALTTHRDIATSPIVRQHLPALAEAAAHIGGNLSHADPSSDLPAVALAYEAKLTVVSADGVETMDADGFFIGPLTTALPEGALVTSIPFDLPPSGAKSVYEKYPHPASGYAVVGVAAVIATGPNGEITHARVGITGAGDVAYRAYAVEEALAGQVPTDHLIHEAASHASEDGMMGEDLFASEAYRAHLCTVYTERALSRI